MTRRLEIIRSEHTGYCFGVKRAMRLIDEGLEAGGGEICTIGDVIHNPQAVERLRNRGLVPVRSLDEVGEDGVLVIRAHGVDPALVEEAGRRGIGLIDTTCPFVLRSQNYVRRLHEEGVPVIIIGDARHPEVQGIAGRAGEDAVILDDESAAADVGPYERAGVVIQTTFAREKAMAITEALRERVRDLRVYDTICQATVLRREATKRLAGKVDLMLVVGGRSSSNTKRLYRMCVDLGVPTEFIETADEIDPSWFAGRRIVGLATGTSTPDWIIEEVLDRLSRLSGE
ncbi:MAG: 4-hydroxy-3-methylbut-2-enyl diphosphate reductase [Candidatus Krumholzibacteriota bacterium]|nr:4-hydroxy-3-methylbut-2-enyl diphosphate reductase [Candidatus Krumholzibacteriota bacterium]